VLPVGTDASWVELEKLSALSPLSLSLSLSLLSSFHQYQLLELSSRHASRTSSRAATSEKTLLIDDDGYHDRWLDES